MDEEQIELSDIGQALIAASESERCSAREVLRELFPYIEEASKRMSSRAISHWLKKNYGVQISPATILRALRAPDKHYQDFAEYIEQRALIVENAIDCSMESFLFDQRIFEHFVKEPKNVCPVPDESGFSDLDEFKEAAIFLREKWFTLSSRAQANCRRFIGAVTDEPEREEA